MECRAAFGLCAHDCLFSGDVLNQFCHKRDVLVSTGGFIERLLAYGPEAVDQYIAEARCVLMRFS
jgi:hypothetical protein